MNLKLYIESFKLLLNNLNHYKIIYKKLNNLKLLFMNYKLVR